MLSRTVESILRKSLCNFLVGSEGLEPPESLDTRFTVWPATCYGIPAHIKLIELDLN